MSKTLAVSFLSSAIAGAAISADQVKGKRVRIFEAIEILQEILSPTLLAWMNGVTVLPLTPMQDDFRITMTMSGEFPRGISWGTETEFRVLFELTPNMTARELAHGMKTSLLDALTALQDQANGHSLFFGDLIKETANKQEEGLSRGPQQLM